MNPRSKRHLGGFTLVEAMVVVAIMAIIAAIAAPNMGKMVRQQRLKTAAFDVFASLSFARSEAIKRNTPVTLTPTNAANWVFGWQVADSNGNVLRNQSGWAAAGETPTIDITGPAIVRFNSAGRLGTAAGDFALTSADVTTDKHRCVSVELSGRAVTKEGSC